MPRSRVLVLADRSLPGVADVVEELKAGLASIADLSTELHADSDPIPDGLEVDVAVAVGGDGTLIGQARRLVDSGLALVGVNVGRLGFLAEFDVADLIRQAESVFGPDPPIRDHMTLHVTVRDADGAQVHGGIAINDCVLTAGPPFRMIEVQLNIDEGPGPVLTGDGVIIATPVGSTAYNVSAGGPIVHRSLDAIVVTPLAAHSLAFRPLVLAGDAEVLLSLARTNEGTTLVIDGQVPVRVSGGHTVEITQDRRRARLVDNPATSYWRILLDKMRWAAPPTYRDRGG